MKDQPLVNSHHDPPTLLRSDIYWVENPNNFLNSFRTKFRNFPLSLLVVGIGIALYALGFSRLVDTALDKPLPIDQLAMPGESDLGFVPYLVSSE